MEHSYKVVPLLLPVRVTDSRGIHLRRAALGARANDQRGSGVHQPRWNIVSAPALLQLFTVDYSEAFKI